MTERRYKALIKLVVVIINTVFWAALIVWSGWMEWHSSHEHAVWILLLLMTHSLAWLKVIETNTDRIPRKADG